MLRKHPLWEGWFGEPQSGYTVVICPSVLGIERMPARFPSGSDTVTR